MKLARISKARYLCACMLAFLLLFPLKLFAQQGMITGKVVDETGESIIGASLDQTTVREKLYYERIFELWGEPNFWNATRLKGTEFLKGFLQSHNDNDFVIAGNAYYAESNNLYTERLYNNGDLNEEFLQRNLLFPIPQSEIDANPSIKDNNPGYE